MTRRPYRLIGVVGDAWVDPSSRKAQLAYELGVALAHAGYIVLTGGHGGIAREASRGAIAASDGKAPCSIALLPEAEHQSDDPDYSVVIPTGLGLARSVLVAQSMAVIAIGGGAGTLAEVAYAWMHKRLLIAFRVDGWSGQLADTRIDHRIRFDTIPDDRVFGVNTVSEALEMLRLRLPIYAPSES